MAFRAAEALRARPDSTLVVLAGTGHVVYGLGIARQIRRWYDGPSATIVPVQVGNRPERVRASVADFVWGVPESAYPAFPELGAVTISIEEGLHVIHVEAESPADLGGLEAGDTLLRLDGVAVLDKSDLNRSLASLRWGDEATLGVERDGDTHDLRLRFRRREN